MSDRQICNAFDDADRIGTAADDRPAEVLVVTCVEPHAANVDQLREWFGAVTVIQTQGGFIGIGGLPDLSAHWLVPYLREHPEVNVVAVCAHYDCSFATGDIAQSISVVEQIAESNPAEEQIAGLNPAEEQIAESNPAEAQIAGLNPAEAQIAELESPSCHNDLESAVFLEVQALRIACFKSQSIDAPVFIGCVYDQTYDWLAIYDEEMQLFLPANVNYAHKAWSASGSP